MRKLIRRSESWCAIAVSAVCVLVVGCVASTVSMPTVISDDSEGKTPELASSKQRQGPDEALYQKAYGLQEQAEKLRQQRPRGGQKAHDARVDALQKQAFRTYHELVKNYPASPRIPNAYLAFGEHYFARGDMEIAREFYERVAQYEDSEVYGYAVYKVAWCQVNLHDDREALSSFVRVIQYAEGNPANQQAKLLARQARRDLIHPFANAFPPNRAWAFFSRIAHGHEREMMTRLAEQYADSGQHAETRTAYHVLMAENERSDRLCHYQLQVARVSVAAQSPTEILLELRRTLDLMNTFSAMSHPPGVVTACRQESATLVGQTAARWRRDAMATRDAETMRLARGLYDAMLDTLPDLDQLQLDGFTNADRPTRSRVEGWRNDLSQALGGRP